MRILLTTTLLLFISICFGQYNFGLEVEQHDARIDGRLNLSFGAGSIYIGENAGINAALNRSSNVVIGKDAGKLLTTSITTTILGNQAGYNLSSGSGNTLLGQSSGSSLIDADRNTFLGEDSGDNVTTGSGNVILGWGAGRVTNEGDNNVIIGHGAGPSSFDPSGQFDGSNNVLIGYLAGNYLLNEVSNILVIESNDPFNPNPLIYGEFDNDLLKVNGTLHISETAKLEPMSQPSTCTTSGEVGTLYFDSSDDQVKVCTANSGWQPLN